MQGPIAVLFRVDLGRSKIEVSFDMYVEERHRPQCNEDVVLIDDVR
jgi:hypothetical protein